MGTAACLMKVPAQPKLLQKSSLQTYFLEAINFVFITKTLCIQLEKARQTPQKYYKNNCFRELFCNNFGQDGSFCGRHILTKLAASTQPRVFFHALPFSRIHGTSSERSKNTRRSVLQCWQRVPNVTEIKLATMLKSGKLDPVQLKWGFLTGPFLLVKLGFCKQFSLLRHRTFYTRILPQNALLTPVLGHT